MSVAILIYEHAAGKPVPWNIIEGLIGASIALAMFHAWREENDLLVAALGNRKLVPRIGGTVLTKAHSPNETSVIVPVTIRNLGSPTIIADTAITMTVDEKIVAGRPQGFLGKLGKLLPDGVHAVEYDETELIGPRGATVPIPNGGQLAGIVFARFPLAESAIQQSLDTLRLVFVDVADNQFPVTPSKAVLEGSAKLIPGLGVIRRVDGKVRTGESGSGPFS